MSVLKTSINLQYGGKNIVKQWQKYYTEVFANTKEVGSADAPTELIQFDNTTFTTGSLKEAKTFLLSNEGVVPTEVVADVASWTQGAPDAGDASGNKLTTILNPGEALLFPSGRMLLYGTAATSSCFGDNGALDNKDPAAINSGALYVDSTVNLAEDVDGTETEIDVSDGDFFEVGDYIQLGTGAGTSTKIEIMKVKSIATNTLTVDRAVASTTANNSSAQTDSTSGSVNGANIYFPFFNTTYSHDKVLKGSSQLAITDGRGRWACKNFFGYGRTAGVSATAGVSGLVPGSVSFVFYNKAYQEIDFTNPIMPGHSTDLSASTAYAFDITIADSAATTLSFTTGSNVNFGGTQGVISKINDALDAAFKNSSHGLYGYKAVCNIVDGRLRFVDGTNMHAHDGTNGSKILLASASSGTNLFSGSAGVFPAVANLPVAISPALPDDEITDSRTGITTTNNAVFMVDDGMGNLIYPATNGAKVGSIDYITGAHNFTLSSKPYASFRFTANYDSAHSGRLISGSSTAANHFYKWYARSVNSKVNGLVGLYAFK